MRLPSFISRYLKKRNQSNKKKVVKKDNIIVPIQVSNLDYSLESFVLTNNDEKEDSFIETKKVETFKENLLDKRLMLKNRIENLFMKETLIPNEEQVEILIDSIIYDNILLNAKAGSGKTTLVPMLVHVQKEINKLEDKDIVCLSMTNNAKNTINKKLIEFNNDGIQCKTIHSFFGDLYELEYGVRAKFSNPESFLPFIQNYLEHNMSMSFFEKYIRSISYEEYSYLDIEERTKRLNCGQILSIKGEKLKSYGELYISSWLIMHGIEYEYEKEYPFCDFQYRPDFYIPKLDLWIEFFGIDKGGNVAPNFTDKKGRDASSMYRIEIKNKQKLHASNNTKLLSLYLWEKMDGLLDEKLNEHLKKIIKNETFKIEDIWKEKTKRKNGIFFLSNYLYRNIMFMESRNLCFDSIKEIAQHKNPNLYGERIALASICEEILKAYEIQESLTNKISFTNLGKKVENKIEEIVSTKKEYLPKYIFIDEFQDIPCTFLNTIKILHENGIKLFFGGDPRQNIYGFAGSISYVELLELFEDIHCVSLSKSRRVPKNIDKIANIFVLKDNKLPQERYVDSEKKEGDIYVIGGYYPQETREILYKILENENKLENKKILFQGRDNQTINWLSEYCKIKANKIAGKNSINIVFENGIQCEYQTFHAAKGAEYDLVFILESSFEGKTFPYIERDSIFENMLYIKSNVDKEEERRILYTAMTRTKNNLYIVSTKSTRGEFVNELLNDFPIKEICNCE